MGIELRWESVQTPAPTMLEDQVAAQAILMITKVTFIYRQQLVSCAIIVSLTLE